MARTFPKYTPKKLKLTEEDLAKVPQGLKVHIGLNRVLQKNGDRYVMERAYYIVPETGKPKSIASVKVGVVRKGETETTWDELPEEPAATVNKTVSEFSSQAKEILEDDRQLSKVCFALEQFWVICFLCALTGRTDAESIADYWNAHAKTVFKGHEVPVEKTISADTVLRLMSLLTVDQSLSIASMFAELEPSDEDQEANSRVIVAIDGQSVRASRMDGKRCAHILNLYNCTTNQFMGQCVIDSKESEVTKTPELLEPFDLDGTIVTADALFAKAGMFEAIVEKGADYCIPIKDNARGVKKAIDKAFTDALNATDDKPAEHEMKQIRYEGTLEHGRIENREIYVLPGSVLPEKIRNHWVGLDEGCIVQYCTSRKSKKTGKTTTQMKRVVSSVRWDTPNVEAILGVAIRRHWGIENGLHWKMDVAFRQDRIQCKNGKYIYARTWLNKTALNLLENYKAKTKSSKSLERLMVEMHNPKTAIKCLKLNLL